MIKNRTFLLLFANVLLAIFIFFNLKDDPYSVKDIASDLSEMISEMDKITFEQPVRGQEIILRKKHMHWYVTEPVSWPVEPVTLANLVSKLSHIDPVFVCTTDALVSKGEIPQDYGFDKNSSSLRLSSSKKNLQLILGDITRDQTERFLLIENSEGKGIWRVPRQIEDLLTPTTVDWAKLSFFDPPLYAIDEIKVVDYQTNQPRLVTTITKLKESWGFSSPIHGPANDEEVSLLLHQIINEKLSGFSDTKLDENFSKLFDISIRAMGSLRTLTLYQSLQGEATELFASLSDRLQTFTVQPEFVEVFENLSTKLREKRLFSLGIDKVKRVKIIEGNQSITLRKGANNSWIGLEDNGTDSISFQAGLPLVVKLFHKLNAVEVQDFIMFNPNKSALSMHGFAKPQLRLEIEQNDTNRQILLISKSHKQSSLWNTYFTDQALICLVNTQWNKILSTRAIDFKKQELLPDQFLWDRVVLKSLTEDKILHTFSYESDGEAYDRIKDFKADSFIELNYNDEGVWVEGDWLPWKYSICFENNNEIKSIIFNLTDRHGATKWFAGSEELGMVCNLPISVIDELSKGLMSKPLGP
jgi:hypothetical protein